MKIDDVEQKRKIKKLTDRLWIYEDDPYYVQIGDVGDNTSIGFLSKQKIEDMGKKNELSEKEVRLALLNQELLTGIKDKPEAEVRDLKDKYIFLMQNILDAPAEQEHHHPTNLQPTKPVQPLPKKTQDYMHSKNTIAPTNPMPSNIEHTGSNLVTIDVENAKYVMQKFQQLKRDLLDKEDVVSISGKNCIKRSGWRKIALAFNLTTSVIDVQVEERSSNWVRVTVKAEAKAQNGRTAEEMASCDTSEFTSPKIKATYHNVYTKAVTRAINRAISDLVGGGEVSAEEMDYSGEVE